MDTGTLRVKLTDAPACGFDQVNVTVQKVRVHKSPTAAEADAGWSELVLNPARRINLLDLTNGVLEELGEMPLPAGTYTQLRLVLAENDSSAPLENSVVPTTGRSEVALDTPSAQQTGLKMKVNLEVPASKVLDVVLDFDACKSVVKRGSSGRYNLKPVVTVTPVLSDAGLRIVGWVDRAIASTETTVSAQTGGTPVKATPPDATGKFVLYPVPVGTYDLVVTAQGRVTAVMTGVPVTETAYTYVNSEAVRIAPSVGVTPPRSVAGTVNPATATVRALQTFTSTAGPTVEVASAPVDGDTGAFAFSLPVDKPGKTAYVPNPSSLAFAVDAGWDGTYKIEAASGGAVKAQTVDVDAPVTNLSFVFP
jgi:hypothetical protein